MSHGFSVGDLVVLQHADSHFEYGGSLAVIVGGLARRAGRDMATLNSRVVLCYEVSIFAEPDVPMLVLPHQIRPLRGEPERSSLDVPEEVADVEER